MIDTPTVCAWETPEDANTPFRWCHSPSVGSSAPAAIDPLRIGDGHSAKNTIADSTSAHTDARASVGTTVASTRPAPAAANGRIGRGVERSEANATSGQNPIATAAARPPP